MKKYSPSIKTLYKGQNIFKEGQPSNVAYLIKSGRVEISRQIEGKQVVLATLGKGEIFGEMAVITKGVRTADAEAAEYCELMVLNEQLLDNLLKQSPSTIRLLTSLLIKRLKVADRRIHEQDTPNAFFSFCKLLHLYAVPPQAEDNRQRGRGPAQEQWLNWKQFLKEIKSIVLISLLDASLFLHKLTSLNMVEAKETRTARQAAFPDRLVRIVNPETFLEAAESVSREMAQAGETATAVMEYEDINDFAARIKVDPAMLYKKMANMEIPEDLFFFPRERGEQWAKTKDPSFFQKLSKLTKAPEDLSDADDIVYVDNPTLKKVFADLGYHKLAVLYAMCTDRAREKIERNLAKKLAKIIKEQAAVLGEDPGEGPDVEEEVLALIRQAKGVEG